MNIKDLNKKAQDLKVVTTPKYNFNNCEQVYDISDGVYNAYVETLALSNKMATIRLYLKNSYTDVGVLLNYNIGFTKEAYTAQHTTDIQLQLKTDKEFVQKHSNYWKAYLFNLNELLAQGMSEDVAKASFLSNVPKWYVEGYYKDLGNIIVKASHFKNKNGELQLQLGFSEYLINKATK